MRGGGAGGGVFLLGELAALAVFVTRELFVLSDSGINIRAFAFGLGREEGGGCGGESVG